MTSAEKEMVLYLIYDGGCDCCQKCAYLNSENCCIYNPESGYSDKEEGLDDDCCIEGMVKYFEQQEVAK